MLMQSEFKRRTTKLISRSTWPSDAGRRGESLIAILLAALGLLGLSERRRRLVRFVLMVWIVVGLIAVMLCMQSYQRKASWQNPTWHLHALTVVGTSTSSSSPQHSVPAQLIVTP